MHGTAMDGLDSASAPSRRTAIRRAVARPDHVGGYRLARWCVVTLSVLSTVPALASGRISLQTEASMLTAEQVVQVVWTALPDGVDEFELLLLLEDARAPIRLTDELAPERRSYRFRVPPLTARAARLAIRFNRGHGEESGPVSAEFAIVTPRRVEPLPVAFRSGELWVTAPFVPSWSEPPPAGSRASRSLPQLWQGVEPAFFRLGQDADVSLHDTLPHPSPSALGGGVQPANAPTLSRRPRVVPLRD